MNAPWLTIITVVKDDPDGFAVTASSVAGQDLTDVELVVVDSSLDRHAIATVLEDPGLGGLTTRTTYEWVAPSGIYPAMNEGLSRARGRHVLFLNAGDCLASTRVLELTRMLLSSRPHGWAFGPVEIVQTNGSTVITPPWDFGEEKRHSFARGHFPCHQGTFAPTGELRAIGGFDASYQIAADYAVFLHLAQSSDPIELNFLVARFAEGGVSTQHWAQSFVEFHQARRRILRPRGVASVVEYMDTVVHFANVATYRTLVRRWRMR